MVVWGVVEEGGDGEELKQNLGGLRHNGRVMVGGCEGLKFGLRIDLGMSYIGILFHGIRLLDLDLCGYDYLRSNSA